MKFKIWCLQNGYTIKKVSEKTGLSFSTIAAYYRGVRNPSEKTKLKLLDTIGAPTSLFD